ncbi:MAG: DUF167 domain-containing protein [Bdellovibrionales bacterium]|nr:DUF167 domain-containing protein [Bdellovibrionales bacterium]
MSCSCISNPGLPSGTHGERLKVKIKASPVEGEANAGAIEFFAECLKISKSKIFLIRGESSRQKDLLVELPLDNVISLLRELLRSEH